MLAKMQWHSLPLEIQMQILETLLRHHDDSAQYAAICRAWQNIIEPRNFAHLKVTRSRLAGFSDIGYRHRQLVRHIWFSIEPAEDRCPHCGGLGMPNWRPASTEIVRKAIQDLVIHLSVWEPRSGSSLVLDVSVQAPNAVSHSSSPIQYGPGVGFQRPKKVTLIDCSHWVHDTNVRDAYTCVLNKISPQVSEPEPEPIPSHEMPKARAVTGLRLRRQTRRPWKAEVLEEILRLLPGVHDIVYEPWKDWRRMQQRPTNTREARDYLPS